MAESDTAEEVVIDELSDDEALRQMEEAFLAGPAGQSDLAPVTVASDEAAEAGETASQTESEPETAVQSGTDVDETQSAQEPQKTEAASGGLTDDKVLELLKTSQTTEELRAGIKKLRDETFGRVGGLERTLKALQEGLAAPGQESEIEEHFAELKAEYPDAAPLIIKGIKQAMKQAKSIAITTAEPPNPDELVQKILPSLREDLEKQVDVRFVERVLDREHKGWRDIVGAAGSQTPFRVWLNGKPDRDAILGSYDVEVLSNVLTEFKESQKSKTPTRTPAPSNRTHRLEEAVTQKGNIKPPAPRQKTAEEEMEEGFSAGPAGRR